MMASNNGHSTTPLLIGPQHILRTGLFGGIDVPRSGDDDALNVLNDKSGDLPELLLWVAPGVRDLNHEVLRESRTYDATRNLGEKWIVDLMHDQPDHRGGPAGQLPC